MIIDCPACGAALMFDPETGKMKCEACDSTFEPYELEDDFQARGEKEMRYSSFDEKDDADRLGQNNQTGSKLVSGGLKLAGAAAGTSIAEQTAAKESNVMPEFDPYSNFDHPVYDHSDKSSQAEYGSFDNPDEMMECKMYTCTSCGAEVAINGVEASTFCSFCGQPTVVFNRVASQRKPKYIIPFSVTKDRAITLIRQRLNKGFYVPDAIKNFEIERVRGIYIPFWLYDVYYHDRQALKGTVGSGKNSHTYYYYREADCDFTMMTLDASKQLNDETSQRLEPYNMDGIKDFSLEYLSGFYADCYDMETSQLDGLALTRSKQLFDKQVEKTIDAHSISILDNKPDFKILKTQYAMFPAWFLTFRYENIPYTLLVNGQTEKIIGGVPYDRAKVSTSFGILAAVFSVIATIIAYALFQSDDEDVIKLIMTAVVMSGVALASGLGNLKKVKESAALTSLSSTNSFVRDRGKQ